MPAEAGFQARPTQLVLLLTTAAFPMSLRNENAYSTVPSERGRICIRNRSSFSAFVVYGLNQQWCCCFCRCYCYYSKFRPKICYFFEFGASQLSELLMRSRDIHSCCNNNNISGDKPFETRTQLITQADGCDSQCRWWFIAGREHNLFRSLLADWEFRCGSNLVSILTGLIVHTDSINHRAVISHTTGLRLQ